MVTRWFIIYFFVLVTIKNTVAWLLFPGWPSIPNTGTPPPVCDGCNDFGFCADGYGNGTCNACICPKFYSGDCCETPPVSICLLNPCTLAIGIENWDCTDLGEGIRDCQCSVGWTGTKCDTEIEPCDLWPCFNGGTCVELNNNGTKCNCPNNYLGLHCEANRHCNGTCGCQANTCANGATCIETSTGNNNYRTTCHCPEGYTGNRCEREICSTTNCLNGGKCIVNSAGKEVCECLSIWSGDRCENFDACQFWTCQNNGNCMVTNNEASCSCPFGWDGENCEKMKDNCDPNPCQYKQFGLDFLAPCTSIFGNYLCGCPPGSTGKNCTDNYDDCQTYRGQHNCNKKDSQATCLDGLNEYKCVCGPDYTGVNCSTSMIVWKVAQLFGGLDEIFDLLEDVVNTPSLIKDLMPFLLGQQSKDNQSAMSWDYDDLFVWASYEKNELHQETDFYQTFDTTLGNCFTFNHANCSKKYSSRKAGEDGGFKALMRVRQDEYLAWLDTASLLVFVHPPEEIIFAESVRYSASPNTTASIITQKNSYSRLSGRYGTCISSTSEVGSYYYNGSYTTSGCFRGCYQDVVYEECGCMDPRYAFPDHIPACNITAWDCVNKVTEDRGDASTWDDCICSSPCDESQFESAYSTASFPASYFPCKAVQNDSEKFEYCMGNYSDMVLISVYIPRLTHKVFAERPALSLTTFISSVGGIAGVFIGFSVVTVFDFISIFLYLGYALAGRDIKDTR